jgi:hypothetical protein
VTLVHLSSGQRDLLRGALATFNDIQQSGATSGGTDDDLIASKATVDASTAASPPAPLFLPLPDVPGGQQAKIFRQISDNGQAGVFAAMIARQVVVTGRGRYGVAVSNGSTSVLITDTGNLPHSTGAGIVGVPVDSPDAQGNRVARYVEIFDPATGLPVADGGDRVFGRTTAVGATHPNSVTVEFFKFTAGSDPSGPGASFTWTGSQPGTVMLRYGFRQAVGVIDETAFRQVFP